MIRPWTHNTPLNVRLAPKATEIVRCRDMTLWAHVWRAPGWQGESSHPQGWSVQPCVRPLRAVHMTAGHNALRGSGPGQKPSFKNALADVGSPAAPHYVAFCLHSVMSASLIGRLGSSAFRLSIATVSTSLTGSCFSSESAPRPFHYGIRRRGGTIFTAALPSDRRQIQADTRTHLIHRPARDIVPPRGGAPPIGCDPVRLSCCCEVSGPAELGPINPYAVHDNGQPACQCDDRLLHPAMPGNLHRPGLEPGPFC